MITQICYNYVTIQSKKYLLKGISIVAILKLHQNEKNHIDEVKHQTDPRKTTILKLVNIILSVYCFPFTAVQSVLHSSSSQIRVFRIGLTDEFTSEPNVKEKLLVLLESCLGATGIYAIITLIFGLSWPYDSLQNIFLDSDIYASLVKIQQFIEKVKDILNFFS